MSVSAPNLTIDVSIQTGCLGLTLTDNTGVYDAITNPFGYGLPGGPAVNDVTGNTIKLTYNNLSTYILYTFTISSGTITAATLSVNGATAVNILSDIPSTSWPFSTGFDMTADYGVAIPTFGDDVFQTDFGITGTVAPDDFDFTTVAYTPVGCATRCCINKMWIDIDPSCSCSNEATNKANYAEALYNQFVYACQDGNLTVALTALNEAQKFCENCGCGC